MSSAFPEQNLQGLIKHTHSIGAQGIDLCVFRTDGTRNDHVATHLPYQNFNLEEANEILEKFNKANLKLSIGAFENLIGGDENQRLKNQDHLLGLIRMAHLMGGDDNDIKVGTFVGYNHELGVQEGGFEKNLEEYQRVFKPIVKYAEDLGVTILYENCPMEGWRSQGYTNTFNNLSGVLAARKLMYALIPSKSHGEIYDPSHDVWQHTDPVDIIKETDISRIHRIHVKATRNLENKTRTYWGGMYPVQSIHEALARKAKIPTTTNAWDRHNYEAMLPGFGGSDSLDWRAFVDILKEKEFSGPFEIENEALNSKGTGNLGATVQGFKATVLNLSPMIWSLTEKGYQYDTSEIEPLKNVCNRNIPVVSMREIS